VFVRGADGATLPSEAVDALRADTAVETAIFDRGRSSLKRCAHLENYPGFPGGIDIETLYDLFHDHAECFVAPKPCQYGCGTICYRAMQFI